MVYTFNNIGNTFSAKSISDYLKAEHRTIDNETVYSYLEKLEKAYLLHRCSRYDLQGKEILKTQEKFYLADVSMRYSVLGYNADSVASSLENVVYLELCCRGYTVNIGKTSNGEIDFVAARQNEKLYVQITQEIRLEKTKKQENLVIRRKCKRKYNSYKGEITPSVENIIDRNFHAAKPNQKWLTDITEFSIKAGKVYLSPVIDCLDGMPVCWTIGTSPNAELTNTMLKNAIATLKPDEKTIVHSDRGCHYRWPEWIKIMEESGLTRSMSKKGCSPDNSACEGFFGHLKTEMFYGRNWDEYSIDDFIQEVNAYIHWYRCNRIKSTLGGLSPLDYRRSIGIAV